MSHAEFVSGIVVLFFCESPNGRCNQGRAHMSSRLLLLLPASAGTLDSTLAPNEHASVKIEAEVKRLVFTMSMRMV